MKRFLISATVGIFVMAAISTGTHAADPTPPPGTPTLTLVVASRTPTVAVTTQTSTPVATATGTVTAAAFVVRIPGTALDQDQRPFFEEGMHTPALRFQQVSAWVAQQRCATVDLRRGRAANGDAVIVLGTGNQPSDCSKEGSTVRFTVTTEDKPLFATVVLKRGGSVELTNLLPPAPRTGDGGLLDPAAQAQADYARPPTQPHRTGWVLLSGAVAGTIAGALLLVRRVLTRRRM
jgi:hypothetical protein